MAKVRRQNNDDISTVGDVVQSILSEAQFQALRGANWVLCDGRSVAGSKLATQFGVSVLPDARGMFLRGKNNGRSDGNQDPSGERSLGNMQADAMQGHTHFNVLAPQPTGAGDGVPQASATGQTTRTSTMGNPASDGSSGTPRTANETRPKNLAINFFIRIN